MIVKLGSVGGALGGVGGIAVGFAAKDLLANFFGGRFLEHRKARLPHGRVILGVCVINQTQHFAQEFKPSFTSIPLHLAAIPNSTDF